MLIIPAIDIKGGRCVRLTQGQAEQETIYHSNPVDCAKLWAGQGASRLHLVDLDGAFAGETASYAIIKQIRSEFPDMEIQVGGGIRREQDALKYLAHSKINYIIIGTLAVREPQLVARLAEQYPQQIYLACDIKDGRIHNQGWQEAESISVDELLGQFAAAPLAGLIVTDIKNDGMLRGVEPQVFMAVAQQTSLPVIAAGGVTDLQDIAKLKDSGQVSGAICGKAIYEQTLDLREAIKLAAGAS